MHFEKSKSLIPAYFHTLNLKGPKIKYLMLHFMSCHVSLSVSLENNTVFQDYMNTKFYLILGLPVLMLNHITATER